MTGFVNWVYGTLNFSVVAFYDTSRKPWRWPQEGIAPAGVQITWSAGNITFRYLSICLHGTLWVSTLPCCPCPERADGSIKPCSRPLIFPLPANPCYVALCSWLGRAVFPNATICPMMGNCSKLQQRLPRAGGQTKTRSGSHRINSNSWLLGILKDKIKPQRMLPEGEVLARQDFIDPIDRRTSLKSCQLMWSSYCLQKSSSADKDSDYGVSCRGSFIGDISCRDKQPRSVQEGEVCWYSTLRSLSQKLSGFTGYNSVPVHLAPRTAGNKNEQNTLISPLHSGFGSSLLLSLQE